MTRAELPSLTITAGGQPQRSSSTIGSVGAYAVVVATALPDAGVTLTSVYLSALAGDVGAMHLTSMPGRTPQIAQRVLRDAQPGQTHARVCLLDHVAELQTAIAGSRPGDELAVAIDVPAATLHAVAGAWSDAHPDA